MPYFFIFKTTTKVKHIIFLLCFAFIGVSAIAESPPDFSEVQKIEMNNHAQPDLVASTVAASQEDGNLFLLKLGRISCTPAAWHGNTLRSCCQGSDEINSTTYQSNTITAPIGHIESNADFKVGWQGTGLGNESK